MPKKPKLKPLPEYLAYVPARPPVDDLDAFFDSHNERRQVIREKRQTVLEAHKAGYEQEKNPLFVWDAYSIARRNGDPLPEWILEYFDQAATKMLKAENKPEDLPEILGFRWKKQLRNGGDQAWQQYHKLMIRQEAVGHVLNYQQQHDSLLVRALEYATEKTNAKWGTEHDLDTIKKWYQEFVLLGGDTP